MMGGCEISVYNRMAMYVQGRQASVQLIRIIRCPGSLLGFLKAPLWLDDFEPEGFINYLGVTRYV